MTKIDLITGFLGAGKTTFLKLYAAHLIQQGYRIAILVNDFGAVNVDRMLLQELQSAQCQIEMISGGCDADCYRRRFKTQLIALGMQQFDRVLVEPSGIFDMDTFFDILYESPLDKWFTAGSILGIVDVHPDRDLSEQMRYVLASELVYCNQLIISKYNPDNFNNPDISGLPDMLLEYLNSILAEIKASRTFAKQHLLIKKWEDFTVQDYAAFMDAGYTAAGYVKRFSVDTLQSQVHYFLHVEIPEQQIAGMITDIMQDATCGNVSRIKGALPSVQGFLKINATGDILEIQPVPDGQAVLVVIGQNLHLDAIQKYITDRNTNPAYQYI